LKSRILLENPAGYNHGAGQGQLCPEIEQVVHLPLLANDVSTTNRHIGVLNIAMAWPSGGR
jgi:hypothetical protein